MLIAQSLFRNLMWYHSFTTILSLCFLNIYSNTDINQINIPITFAAFKANVIQVKRMVQNQFMLNLLICVLSMALGNHPSTGCTSLPIIIHRINSTRLLATSSRDDSNDNTRKWCVCSQPHFICLIYTNDAVKGARKSFELEPATTTKDEDEEVNTA